MLQIIVLYYKHVSNYFYCCTVHSDILVCTVHSPTNELSYFIKLIKIYIKIHINIVSTCFGLRPSSGSLH